MTRDIRATGSRPGIGTWNRDREFIKDAYKVKTDFP
jgi:hypothetical protein